MRSPSDTPQPPPVNAHTSAAGRDALTIFHAGVAAVEPRHAVHARLAFDAGSQVLTVGDHRLSLNARGRLFVVGAGKAAGPMAAAVEEILGGHINAGVVVTKYRHHTPLRTIRLREAGHPVPDDNGLAAGREIVALLDQAGADDVVICLVSGGGSALLPAPVAGITLHDKSALTDLLLASGARIDEINCVRKHLSDLKGGRLAQHAAPARVINLILSDVIGDPLDAIASGPTVPDPTTFADALAVLEQYRITAQVPAAILQHLKQGAAGTIAETPKPGAALFARVVNVLVANNRMAVAAAANAARRLGYATHIVSTALQGESRAVAAQLAAQALGVRDHGDPVAPPAALIAGGETTVTLTPDLGRGGRNQELALAAALAIEDQPGLCILSAGTDGNDGPTDAAGAVVDGTTLARSRAAGLDARQHLARHDAYPLFQRLGDLVITGPTHTNVMDLQIILVRRA